MPRLRRLAPLLFAGIAACVSGADEASNYAGCVSAADCKDGRACVDGACQSLDGTGGTGPGSDQSRVLFRLTLDAHASAPVYVESASTDHDDAWVTLFQGRTRTAVKPIAPTCQYCFCGACASCGDLCGPGVPAVKRLDPGESVDVRWDGAVFPVDSTCPGDGPCWEVKSATEGGEYEARFCWSLAASGEGPNQWLEPPLYCEYRTLFYSGERPQLVEYRITEGS